MRYITVEIYKHNGDVSPLNSISYRVDRVALPCVDGPLEDADIAGIPVIRLVRQSFRGRDYVHAEPEADTRHAMYGGCILDSSDSRFQETTGVLYPIKLHDRFEPATTNETTQTD